MERDAKLKPRKFARQLRAQMNLAERLLWSRLRKGAIAGCHFRRQHPIGPYIADFACIAVRLIIEVDGVSHGYDEVYKRDVGRDAFLRQHGWRVLRFSNEAVYSGLDGVVRQIEISINAASPPRAGEELHK